MNATIEKVLAAVPEMVDVEMTVDECGVVHRAILEAYRLGRADMRDVALAACRRNRRVLNDPESYSDESEGVRRVLVEVAHADDFEKVG